MPWDWSAEARAAIDSRVRTDVTRVDVLHSGKPVYRLKPVSGGVGADAARPIRRNLTCGLVDPTGKLTRGDVGDLLNAYDCEIAPHRGVRVSTGDELAPLGVFGITDKLITDDDDNGLTISLTGQDRSMHYQVPMISTLAIPGGTPVEVAVARLLSQVNPGVSMLATVTGFTCGPLVFGPDIDVWAEAQELASSVGARLYHDRTGEPVLALSGPASDRPVAEYAEGGGKLIDARRQENSDTIRNVVVATNPSGSIRVVVKDDDPASPTYAGTRQKVKTLTNQHFGSIKQATQAATAWLAYELGRSESGGISAVVDAGRDVEEVVTVHRPRVGLDRRGVLVSTLEIPLGVKESMSIGFRQSRLAQDGSIVEEPRQT